MLTTYIKSFVSDETGAVTVDWVAITAMLVLIVSIVIYNIRTGVENTSIAVKTSLEKKGDQLNP